MTNERDEQVHLRLARQDLVVSPVGTVALGRLHDLDAQATWLRPTACRQRVSVATGHRSTDLVDEEVGADAGQVPAFGWLAAKKLIVTQGSSGLSVKWTTIAWGMRSTGVRRSAL